MSRTRNHRRVVKAKLAARTAALARPELRERGTLRQPSGGPTSYPIKREDPETRAMVDAFLAKRKETQT